MKWFAKIFLSGELDRKATRSTRLGRAIDYQEFEMGHEISPLVLNEVYKFVQKTLA